MKKNGTEPRAASGASPQVGAHAPDPDQLLEEDTAKLPVLDPDTFAAGELRATERTDNTSVNRAATWARDIQGDVERLEQRLTLLDQKLADANDHATSLQAEVEQRDLQLATFLAELDTKEKRIETLEATIAERDETIGLLESSATERSRELAAVSRSVNDADSRAAVLEDRLQAAKDEINELRGSVHNAKSQEAVLRAEKETNSESYASLRARLHDLENYIDGRRENWIEQKAALKSTESKISSLEATLAASERRVAERDATIDSLEARVVELEHESGEIGGRHREREAAHQEAQALLHERIGEVERLRAQLEQGSAGAGASKTELDALRASLAEKDESLRRLEHDVSKFEAVRAHIDEGQQADRKAINDLQQELARLQLHRDGLTASLEDARASLSVLNEKLDAAEQDSSTLSEENAAQKAQLSILEAELEARDALIASFDSNAARLNQLSRHLNTLDRSPLDTERVPDASEERYTEDLLEADALLTDEDAHEHIETTFDFSDQSLALIQPAENTSDDAILADPNLPEGAVRVRRHAVIALTEVDRPIYAISKPITTIGRSHSSDIRIRDVVVSRLHARLRLDDDNLVIEDLGSKNGVAVNGKTVGRAVLKRGDIVAFGMHEFRYVELGPQALPH